MKNWLQSCFCVRYNWILAALLVLSSTFQLVAEEEDGGKDNPCLDPGTKSDPWEWQDWPDCVYVKYTLNVTPEDDGEVFEKDSDETAAVSVEKETDDDGTITTEVVTDTVGSQISWTDDATGSGATSDDFTTSVGSKTLTADYEENTDSVAVDVVQWSSFGATDTTTDAGDRHAGSGGTLQMVYTDTAREAEVEFGYTSSSPDVSNRFPTWTGNKIGSPSVGDDTVTFNSGSSMPVSEEITAEYTTAGATKTVTIEVVEENKIADTYEIDKGVLKPIQDKINDAINKISDNGPNLTITGSVGYEFRQVDKYDDPSVGLYAKAEGELGAEFPDFDFESPSIPIGSTGLAISVSGSVTETTVTVTLDANLDESQSSPGSVTGSLSGTTTLTAAGMLGLGNTEISPLTVNVSGTTTLSANGDLTYNDKKVDLSGSVGSSAILAQWSVEAKLFGDTNFNFYSDSTTLTNTATNYPYDIELYSF